MIFNQSLWFLTPDLLAVSTCSFELDDEGRILGTTDHLDLESRIVEIPVLGAGGLLGDLKRDATLADCGFAKDNVSHYSRSLLLSRRLCTLIGLQFCLVLDRAGLHSKVHS